MFYEYPQSTEAYKGYVLEMLVYRLHDRDSFHRRCRVYKDGKPIAVSKTKKEAKHLIDHDCYAAISSYICSK